MTQEDQLYRAFGEFVRTAEEHTQIVSAEHAIADAPEHDRIVVVHNVCHVEEDWIAAIERGLIFIGRAIGEDRQFIRSNGEVQPIEKVRHISRESVQHLSKHSDMITREQKEDIVPDKLYTVERLNDYAVYENRFLYALLCRIRDFVAVRYDAIMRAYRLYRGELKSQKKVTAGMRRLNFSLELTDEQDDVFAAAADPECAVYLDRIDKIRQSVLFYLRTPLMLEVSRVEKIKRLTKTNVLRMDKNFREAVTLYEFLLNYEGDGYTIERQTTTLDPVGAEIARELSLPVQLIAFLVYEHGLGVEAYLKEEFEKEEKRREEMRQRELAERIKALKRRIEESGMGMEEYMLALEERNAALEADSRELVAARAKIEELEQTIERMRADIAELNEEIAELNGTIEQLREEMKAAEEEHRRQMEALKAAHEEEIASLKSVHAEQISSLKKNYEEAAERAEQSHREEIKRIRTEYEARLKEGRAKTDAAERQLSAAKKDLESVEHERQMLEARLTALRAEHGLLTEGDDFTTEEGFNALEHEFEVLGRLVRDKWTDVRRMLRKEFFNGLRATMRGQKGQMSGEYTELAAQAQDRRARSAANGPSAPQGTEVSAEESEIREQDDTDGENG